MLQNVMVPHECSISGKGMEVNASVSATGIGCFQFVHIHYGEDVTIRINTEDSVYPDEYVMNLVTSGSSRVEQNGEEWELDPGKGFMCDFRAAFDGEFKNFGVLLVSVPIPALKGQASLLTDGETECSPLMMDQAVDFQSTEGRHLHDTVRFVAEQLNGPLKGMDNPIVTGNVENFLLSQILAQQPNSYLDALRGHKMSSALAYHVKRARDYIHAHAHEKVMLADLASVAGCGYRTLQEGFKSAYGLSPMAYLKSVRLKHVRKALIEAEPGTMITDIAQKWGFTHMGYFSKNYANHFGVLPSETLRFKK